MQKVEKNIIEVILEARDLLKSYNITTSYTYSYTKFETHHIFFKPVISILNNINRKFLKLFKNMDYTSINFYVVSKFVKFTFRYVLKPEALLELKAWTPSPSQSLEYLQEMKNFDTATYVQCLTYLKS